MTTDTLDIKSRSVTSRRITPWIFALPLCFAACAVEPDDVSGDVAPDATALKHCAVNLHGETTCYATFNQAISHATAGRITDAVGSDGVMNSAAFAERVNALGADRIANAADGGTTTNDFTTMIGVAYKAPFWRFNEQTWTFYVPGNVGCDGNLDTSEFEVVNLNASPYWNSDMNDNISSFTSFSNCRTLMWTDWYFSGPTTNNDVPVADMIYVGPTMNDKASSIAWF